MPQLLRDLPSIQMLSSGRISTLLHGEINLHFECLPYSTLPSNLFDSLSYRGFTLVATPSDSLSDMCVWLIGFRLILFAVKAPRLLALRTSGMVRFAVCRAIHSHHSIFHGLYIWHIFYNSISITFEVFCNPTENIKLRKYMFSAIALYIIIARFTYSYSCEFSANEVHFTRFIQAKFTATLYSHVFWFMYCLAPGGTDLCRHLLTLLGPLRELRRSLVGAVKWILLQSFRIVRIWSRKDAFWPLVSKYPRDVKSMQLIWISQNTSQRRAK